MHTPTPSTSSISSGLSQSDNYSWQATGSGNSGSGSSTSSTNTAVPCSSNHNYCINSNHTSLHLSPSQHNYSSASSASTSGAAAASSPYLHSDFVQPPSSLSAAAGPLTFPSIYEKHQHSQSSFYPTHHHLPKSISRSSMSSEGSTALFSPSHDPLQLAHYSPATPPLHANADFFKDPSSFEKPALSLPSIDHQAVTHLQATDPIPIAGNPQQQQQQQQVFSDGMTTTIIHAEEAPGQTLSPTAAAPMQPAYVSQLATYLAEMVVYLWFSPPRQKYITAFPKPSCAFVSFCNDILTTTQVSQSVVVLALYFVSKLQGKHSITPRAGSEYKLTISSLMLANKILDDHTYTNKTWSEVSGLPLDLLNGAEVEFLQGLEFDLHVSHNAYAAWFTMLQNGENSTLERAAPPRKKSRVVNPIAPSAPTSPMHHTSLAFTHSNADAGFDFGFHNASGVSAANAALHPTVQNRPPTSSSHSMCPASSSYRPTVPDMAASASSSSSVPDLNKSRKRRMSDTASSPPRRTPAFLAASQVASLHLNAQRMPSPLFAASGTHPSAASHALPGHSVSINAQHIMQHQQYQSHQGYLMPNYGADFDALTSSFSPADALDNRKPHDLAYYALAAGQQRGGYLTHQPVHTNASEAQLPHHLQQQQQQHFAMYLDPKAGRSYAPLPRSTSNSNARPASSATPVMRQSAALQRMSLSLSPVDVRNLYYHDPRLVPVHGSQHPLSYAVQQGYQGGPAAFAPAYAGGAGYSQLVPPPHPQDMAPTYQGPHRGYPIRQAQTAASSPLEPSLQSLALASSGRAGTPNAGQEQACYSSFANNGLPGVLSWPVNALAKYGNAMNPHHQQAWPRDF